MSVRTRKNVIEELEIEVLASANGHPYKGQTVSPTSGHVYTMTLTPTKTNGYYGFFTSCQNNVSECPGNTHHVCKHSLAMVLHRIKSQGKMLHKCNSEHDAKKLNNILKGDIIMITSQKGVAWGIVTKQKDTDGKQIDYKLVGTATPNDNHRERLAKNRSLLRDENKEID